MTDRMFPPARRPIVNDGGMNDFFRQAFQLQQDMAQKWFGLMTGTSSERKTDADSEKQEPENPFMAMSSLYENWAKKFMENPWMNVSTANDMMKDAFTKMMSGGKTLADLSLVWQQLLGKDPFKSRAEILKFLDENKEAYTKLAQDMMLPFVPETMRPMFDQAQELVKQYEQIGKDMMKPWMELGDSSVESFRKMAGGDMSASTDFYKAVTKAYEESYGKIFNAAGLGLTREQHEAVMTQFDSYFKMMISMTELMALMGEVARENMISVIENYQKMLEEGKQPLSLREFYNLWIKVNEDAFIKFFGTPQFSKIFCEFAKKACEFKIHFDKVMEQCLSWIPVPKNSDMASLYKTTYDLRKSDYKNTQEIEALRQEVASLRAIVEQLAKPAAKRGDK